MKPYRQLPSNLVFLALTCLSVLIILGKFGLIPSLQIVYAFVGDPEPDTSVDLDGVNDMPGDTTDPAQLDAEAAVTEGTFDAASDENEGVAGQPAPSAPDPTDGLLACSNGSTTGSLSWYPAQYTSYYNIWRVDSDTPITNGLLATYFDNKNLTRPISTQIDNNIDKTTWGLGSPDNGKRVNPETFSVKWTGKIQTALEGDYTFITDAKDGVRVWIDDTRVINDWNTSTGITRHTKIINLQANKLYNIRVEYFNDKDIASIKLSWKPPGGSEAVIPQGVLYPNQSNGLFPQLLQPNLEIPTKKIIYNNEILGEYFDGKMFKNPMALIRRDSQINFTTWSLTNPPDPVINPQEFSVRWIGKVKPPSSGYYRFSVTAKDGVRLWLYDVRNINKIIGAWNTTSSVRTITGDTTLPLDANTYYDFKLEYYFDGAVGTPDPNIQLSWETIDPATGLANGVVDKRPIEPAEFASITNPDYRPGLFAQFYDNDTYKGLPISARIDSQVNFNDADLPPASITNTSDYSTVWTGKVKTLPPISGNSYNTDDQYFFYVDTKDKIEVWIDDKKILSKTKNTTTVRRETSSKEDLQPGQLYTIKVKHAKSSGDDTVMLYWSRVGDPAFSSDPQLVPLTNLFNSVMLPTGILQGTGLTHRMYDNSKFSAPVISRSDTRINSADWPEYWSAFSSEPVPTSPTNVPPHPVIFPDNFSDRWVGKVKVATDGTYNFSFNSNDGSRAFLDDMSKNFINQWKDGNRTQNKDKDLIGGKTYDYRVEYYEKTSPSYLTVNVTGPSSPIYTHNYNTNDPITYNDATPSTGQVFYQIAAVGSGGTTYSSWFSPTAGGACGVPVISSGVPACSTVAPIKPVNKIDWLTVPSATEYRIYRDGGAVPIGAVSAPAITYTDQNPTPETTHNYTVSSYNPATGESNPSTPQSVITKTAAQCGGTFDLSSNVDPLANIPRVNDLVTFTGFVSNLGGSDSPTSVVRFCIDDPNCMSSPDPTKLVGEVSLGPVMGGQTVSSPTSPGWVPLTAGTKTIYMCIIPDGEGDTNLTNNCSSESFTVNDLAAWWQTTGGDVHIEGGITNRVPNGAACGLDATYASIADGVINFSPGIMISGNGTPVFDPGTASIKNWVVGTPVDPSPFTPENPGIIRTSYGYLTTTARNSGITVKNFETDVCSDLSNCIITTIEKGIYKTNSDLTIVNPSTFRFPDNTNIIILVNGNLTLKSNLWVPVGSTVTFSAKGNIIVDSGVGELVSTTTCTNPTTHAGCNLEGFYSADGSVVISGASSCSQGIADKRLNFAGAVVANASLSGGSIQNNRDLCTGNLSCPSYSVTQRPDFLLFAPEFLKYANFVWQEVTP